MKTIAVFPGQGSQAVGMAADLADNFASARAVLEQADDALGESLSRLMREGPLEELSFTANAQPALVTASVAAITVLAQDFGWRLTERVDYVAGHSLGEYSANVAAGSLDFSTAVRLVRRRGEAMQRAVPAGAGGMLAVMGMDNDAIIELATQACAMQPQPSRAVCVIANDNAPSQVVLSGDRGAIDSFVQLAQRAGVRKLVPLNVSAPFHSPLMQPAADEMRLLLEQTAFAQPALPVITNVTAAPQQSAGRLCTDLVSQITAQVRWRESMLAAVDIGCVRMLEMGPGKVLAGLMRRIDRSVATVSLGTAEDMESFASSLA